MFFPERGITKLDLVDYYLELAEPVLNHLRDRPTVLKRFVDGAAGEPFFQKRVPDTAPGLAATTTVARSPAAARRASCCPTTPRTSSGASTSA